MAEDVRDISGQENLLDEMNEITINATNVDQKLLRTNPVFDAQRPSSKVKMLPATSLLRLTVRSNIFVVVFGSHSAVRFHFTYHADEGHRSSRESSCRFTVHKCLGIVSGALDQARCQISGADGIDKGLSPTEHCPVV